SSTPPVLPSSPTRRSSDLGDGGRGAGAAPARGGRGATAAGPRCPVESSAPATSSGAAAGGRGGRGGATAGIETLSADRRAEFERSEEHTSELQSRGHLVCR